ncbi:MAG: 3-hydroxyacyl-CoA dehydrogenase NAD-binding domain-containing protein [Flavobacteriales bacterium]
MKVGIIGAGAMGSGIAQVAATAGHSVFLIDNKPGAAAKALEKLKQSLGKLVEKGKYTNERATEIINKINIADSLNNLSDCGLVIEAIVENLTIKQQLFAQLENIVSQDTVLASNTSSLSIASIASACKNPGRVIGVHFFNPAQVMPLVEIIPAVQTVSKITDETRKLVDSWKKVTVLAKDTPGFIVNRVARPYYGESIRIYEEGIADFATIDYAMKEFGSFKMGPFELMDFIGNDVNYTVTETVFREFYYDPRYKPSFTQKRLSEARMLGRKTGKGYYDYNEGAITPTPNTDKKLGEAIFNRVIVMLINEASDALFLNIASRNDIDLAVIKGVNYPKGLLQWADEIGIAACVEKLDSFYNEYHEDRYRTSPLLRRMAAEGKTFY